MSKLCTQGGQLKPLPHLCLPRQQVTQALAEKLGMGPTAEEGASRLRLTQYSVYSQVGLAGCLCGVAAGRRWYFAGRCLPLK